MGKVLVFGEILFDIFPEKLILGGAPLNFACHTALLGGKPFIVSAVGNDELGDDALKMAKGYGVYTDYTSLVTLPTGRCNVTLNNGTPSYDLVFPVAYDEIPFPNVNDTFDGFYFGTLAQRSKHSRDTLCKLLCNNYREIFFDINIRQSFYTKGIIDASLSACTVLKISREEIGVLYEVGITNSFDIYEILRELADKYKMKLVIVTLDKDGALVYDCKNRSKLYSRKPCTDVVSTVGAGDSFSAAFFNSYLKGESIEVCLDKAVTLSSYVVTQLGAVCEYSNELKRRLKIL